MKEQIIRRLLALLSVKSIATLILTVVFSVLAVRGVVTGQEFITIYSVVIAFYFGTQTQKVQTRTEGQDEAQ